LVVRYIPEDGGSVPGNWSHEISYGNKIYSFCWDQDRPEALRSAEMDKKGLCRVAIRNNKFVVLFPKLGN